MSYSTKDTANVLTYNGLKPISGWVAGGKLTTNMAHVSNINTIYTFLSFNWSQQNRCTIKRVHFLEKLYGL